MRARILSCKQNYHSNDVRANADKFATFAKLSKFAEMSKEFEETNKFSKELIERDLLSLSLSLV